MKFGMNNMYLAITSKVQPLILGMFSECLGVLLLIHAWIKNLEIDGVRYSLFRYFLIESNLACFIYTFWASFCVCVELA